MPKRLSYKEKQEIVRLASEQVSNNEIARRIGCSRKTVARIKELGAAPDTTTKGKVLNVRLSEAEAKAFEEFLQKEDVTASAMLRRMVRLSVGAVDLHKREVAEMRKSMEQINALARNLAPILQLGRAGRLKWNKRDAALMERLMRQVTVVAEDLQTLTVAASGKAFYRPLTECDAVQGQVDAKV